VEVEKLNTEAAKLGLDYHYFPRALWSQKTNITFYENKSPGGGSCFPQNTSITDRWKFQNTREYFLSSEIFYPLGTSTWKTITLDDWLRELGGVDSDFMKFNVRGAELEILRGGASLVDGTIGTMAEISFVELYRDRPFLVISIATFDREGSNFLT
jgi:FkbM family methyltransferase